MVGPFGGITAAQLLQAAMLDPRRLGEPLALTVNYGAAVADGPFDIVAVPARTNRSTQHWTLELRQGGQVCTTASAVFAVRRATWSAPELAMPSVPPAAQVAARDPRPARWPGRKRYEFRFVEGRLARLPQPAAKSPTRAPCCGCATNRRGRWTHRRWPPSPTCSTRACSAAAAARHARGHGQHHHLLPCRRGSLCGAG
jgi:hypothetical protein